MQTTTRSSDRLARQLLLLVLVAAVAMFTFGCEKDEDEGGDEGPSLETQTCEKVVGLMRTAAAKEGKDPGELDISMESCEKEMLPGLEKQCGDNTEKAMKCIVNDIETVEGLDECVQDTCK